VWRWLDGLAVAVALVAVLATALVKANAFYGYRPTLATALGLPAANQIELGDLPRLAPEVIAAPRQPLAHTWHSPPGMPPTGRVLNVDIPGHQSGFPARYAWVYLPPAYLGSPRAQLPVLVLIPGQPGGPRDWLLAGRLVAIMDAFAAAHDGLAPVVIVPDVTGATMANTLCLDSRLGAAESYLARDVPAWAAATLQVDTTPWAIGGFSFGGTCALQMAVRHPDLYPTFLDISGQAQPTLGDLDQTVQAAFGGDYDAYRRVNPLDELAITHLSHCAGIITVGHDDTAFRAQAEQVTSAATSAGMTVRLHEVPGYHSWTIATAALADDLAWISGRSGLLEPTPPP
jgi:S-formylglutathione hydrolase FrmB